MPFFSANFEHNSCVQSYSLHDARRLLVLLEIGPEVSARGMFFSTLLLPAGLTCPVAVPLRRYRLTARRELHRHRRSNRHLFEFRARDVARQCGAAFGRVYYSGEQDAHQRETAGGWGRNGAGICESRSVEMSRAVIDPPTPDRHIRENLWPRVRMAICLAFGQSSACVIPA